MPYPILAANSTWYKGTTKRAAITEINIVDSYVETGSENESWNADVNNVGSIKCYINGTVLTIAGNGSGKIYANSDSSYAFSDKNRKDYFGASVIAGADILDTRNVTSMRLMFTNYTALRSIDVSNWDVSKVTDMAGVFQLCHNLTYLDVSKWNTELVNIMQNMFYECSSLTELDVSNWNISNVTNMHATFFSCTSLTELDVAPKTVTVGEKTYTAWNTSKVTDFCSMFQGNQNAGDMKFSTLSVNNWDTSSATDMSSMFYSCGQLTELDLSKWDVSKVTTMSHMFADCFKMVSYNFSGWNTTSLTNMDGIFNDNRSLPYIDLSDFNTEGVTTFAQMFENCHKLATIDGLECLDVSKNTKFHETFSGCSSLTELNLSTWDTSSTEYLYKMFYGCSKLKTIYVSDKWSTDGLRDDIFEDIAGNPGINDTIFYGCSQLVGGAGTAWADNHVDYSTAPDDRSYARIDGGSENPGYFTNYHALTQYLIQHDTMASIADAIRAKTGKTDSLSPADMPTEIAGIGSSIDASDATAVASDILSGKTAYVNGGKVVGTIPSQDAQTITPSTVDQQIAAGKYLLGTQTIQGDPNLVAENIKNGVNIFGVLGTLSAGSGDWEVIEGTITPTSQTQTLRLPWGKDTLPLFWLCIHPDLDTYVTPDNPATGAVNGGVIVFPFGYIRASSSSTVPYLCLKLTATTGYTGYVGGTCIIKGDLLTDDGLIAYMNSASYKWQPNIAYKYYIVSKVVA